MKILVIVQALMRVKNEKVSGLKRLKKTFKDIYGLDLFYVSWYPLIGTKDTENGSVQELVHAIFYN